MNTHPYDSNSNIYNVLFHPFHKKENKTLAIITNVALTIITGFLWQIPFWILNRIDNRKIVQWKASINIKGTENTDTIGRAYIDNTKGKTKRTTKDNKKSDKTNSTLTLNAEEFKRRWLSGRLTQDQKIHIEGNLYLAGCTGLTSLPDNLSVQGNLDLRDCTSLESLPENLSVKGVLDLSGCTSLQSLPDNLSVQGDLYLAGCTRLTTLPDTLSVQGNLDLSGCTTLESLPENLSVQGDLYPIGCTSLQSLPENLSVQGDLNL